MATASSIGFSFVVALVLLLPGCGVLQTLGAQSKSKRDGVAGSEVGGGPSCAPGEARYQGQCLDVAVSLHGLRLEMPCKNKARGRRCLVGRKRREATVTLLGNLAQIYEVELRIRGVIEHQRYTGGLLEEPIYRGGEPLSSQASTYRLEISEPETTLFLNPGDPRVEHVLPVDYVIKVSVNGAARVTLVGDARDWRHLGNRGPDGKSVIVPDIAPSPKAFNGQFLQIDVLSVRVIE